MKIPILVAGCVLALAVSVWCVRPSIGNRSAETLPGSPTVDSAAVVASPHSPEPSVSNNMPVSSRNVSAAVQAAQYTLSSAPVLAPENPASSHESRQGTSNRSSVESTPSVTSSTSPSTAVSSNANSAIPNADPGAIELEPGVPAPAALMPPEESLPLTVAVAHQHLADSFVQDVNAAINQPGTSDAAASDIYDKSLSSANEQYRALFGDAAYNSASIKAGIDAQAGR